MKIMMFIFICLSSFQYLYSQSVGIGTTSPNSSAILDLTSTNKGLLPPRMTTGERDAIPSPQPGLIIFNTSTQSLEFYTLYGWSQLKSTVFSSVNKLYGGLNHETSPYIQQTSDGGFIVAGSTNSYLNGDVTDTTRSPAGTARDCWVVKFNASGNIQWNRVLGGTQLDNPYNIQQTNDGGYVMSAYAGTADGDVSDTTHGSNDYWVVKLDPGGNIIYNLLLGGSGQEANSTVNKTTDGGVIICGTSMSMASGNVTGNNHNASTTDLWVVKLNAAGNIMWDKMLGGTGNESSLRSSVPSISQTADGGYILSASSTSSANGDVTGINHGNTDIWVVKLNSLGNITWNKLLGGTGEDESASIVQTADGGYILTGNSYSSANGDVTGINHGGMDFWILKLDASGNITWNKLFGGINEEYSTNILQTNDGGYLVGGSTGTPPINGDVTGNYHAQSNTNGDIWLLKLNASGNISWSKLLGSSGGESLTSMQQTADGGFILGGTSSSTSPSGDISAINHGGSDWWIIKVDANGNKLD